MDEDLPKLFEDDTLQNELIKVTNKSERPTMIHRE